MNLSEIDLYNMALSKMTVRARVRSASEVDRSNEAATCKIHYHISRAMTLEKHDWYFARRFRTVPQNSDISFRQWGGCYTLPSSMIAFRGIAKERLDIPDYKYEIMHHPTEESNLLFTDVVSPQVIYTDDIQNIPSFSPTFVDAMTWCLAYLAGPQLGVDLGKVDMAEKQFRRLVDNAAVISANQDDNSENHIADWIAGR